MNEFLKYAGVVLVLLGVVLLGVYAFQNMVSNTLLVVSALLLIGGVAMHVILNRIFE
ncbi:hypothetical protein [Alkaliflexus imshenetskii]|uniref:hypothetical protein n=1 Tax=Alkaliflexus imshenetskii TaxID=286730 RepID=UPI0004BCECA9|nr:hypothetical protein [Alkaliflexus imshenetskii]